MCVCERERERETERESTIGVKNKHPFLAPKIGGLDT